MRMYKGVQVEGLAFFQILTESDEFCAELGRVVLAAGRLENALVRVFERDDPNRDFSKATLGQLKDYAKQHESLRDIVGSLGMVSDHRNYLTHNIHALLSFRIDETILERSDLLDSDVWTYTERAWTLKNNLNALAEIVEKQLGECA